MQRVAITAIGVVSPIGCGFSTFADNLLRGRCGVQRLCDVFGAAYSDVPVRYGAPSEPRAVGARALDADRSHRSIRFAVDAWSQMFCDLQDSELARASVHCGVGVGQLFPELTDLRRYGPAEVLAALERYFTDSAVPRIALESPICADDGTALLAGGFGLEGAQNTYNGTCSASTQALIGACEDVLDGATYAVGGGHDSFLSAAGIYMMHALGTLSEEPSIRPFDLNRDGTLLGEGATYFLLENFEHARARGARIFAEVVGWSSSFDGYHVTSPDPTGEPSIAMIRRALRDAQVQPSDIDYVNAHGTSTMLNDLIESNIINSALDGHRAYVSSSKAQVGHLIAACGAIGTAACVAALERQTIPPNPNTVDPDPECDIQLAPMHGLSAPIDCVLCNSFGFGGQNCCVVLRRPVEDGAR